VASLSLHCIFVLLSLCRAPHEFCSDVALKDNVAGLVDLRTVTTKTKIVALYHTLFYWEAQNRIVGDYPRFRTTKRFSFKKGLVYQLL